MSSRKKQVLVLGAGVNGLSSALRIQESCRNVEVTVMAEKFSPHTTSDGVPGFWTAYSIEGTDPTLVHDLGGETFKHLRWLAMSSSAPTSGIQQTSGYFITQEKMEKDFYFNDIVDGYRRMTEEEIARYPMAKDGVFYTSLTTDMTAYLKWLTGRITSNGGRLTQRKINSLKELSSDWDVIVNCMGLGAHEVLGDDQLFPTKGQILRVYAPWIKHFYLMFTPGGLTHILPNVDYVTIGGTSRKNDWSETFDEEDEKDIWARVIKVVPSIKDAKVLKKWAGLRPTRKELRLEPEVMDIGDEERKLRVVHNYGHGGGGLSIHWGCAGKTADMVSTFLHNLETEARVV